MPEQYPWRFSHHANSHAYLEPAILKLISRFDRSARILDLGCGNGTLTAAISEAGYDVIGVEPSEQGVSRARASFPNLRFECGSAYDDLAGTFGKFDVIVSAEVIEHLYSPNRLLARAREALAPGGRLIITTPYHGYLKNLLIAATGRWDKHHSSKDEHQHIKFFSMGTLSWLLEKEGFQVELWRRLGRVPALAKSMVAVCKIA